MAGVELADGFGITRTERGELGIGADITDRLSIEGSWVHLSHAQLFGRQNPGMDNIGIRLNLKL